MTRQVTDNLYIDLGYFTPEEYYTYEARASAAKAVSASLSADVGVIKQGASTQDCISTLSATISHIEGADIVLNNFAAVSASATVTRSLVSNIDSAATFYANTDGGIVQNASANLTSEFTQTASVERIAGLASTQSSTVTLAVDAVANRSAAITVDTIGNLNAQADRSRDYSSSVNSEFNILAPGSVITENDAYLEYEIPNITVSANYIADADIDAGALFTPTITVNVLKNHTAILETTTTQTASAIKTAIAQSSLSSAVSIVAQVNQTFSINASMASASTVTASVSRTRAGASTQTSTATMSVTAKRVSRAGITFALSNAGQITSAQSKFGAGSLGFITGQTPGNLIATVSPHLQIDMGSFNWTMDFWHRQTSNASGSYFTIASIAPTGINIRLSYLYDGSTHVYRLQYTSHLGSTQSVDTTGTPIAVPLNQWNHYRISGQVFSSQTTIISFWLNGTRRLSVAAQYLPGSTSSIAYRGGSGINFDEIRLYNGNLTDQNTLTFTPPSTAFVNDSSTRYLLHLDTDIQDDNVITSRLGQASLSTVATVTAQATELVGGSANLTSAVTQTALATRTRSANANLASAGFVITVAGYLQDDVADLTSAFSQSTSANITASANSTQTTSATLTAVGGFLKTAASQPFVEFHVDADVNVIPGITVNLSSTAAQTTSADRLRGITANLLAEGFTVTIAGEQQNVQATLSSVTTLSATLGIVKEFASTQSSQFTQSANVGLLADALSTQSSEFAQTSSGDRIRLGTVTETVTASLSADIDVITDSQINLNSESALTAINTPVFDAASVMIVGCSHIAQVNVVTETISAVSAQITQTAQGNYRASANINGAAEGFVIAITAYTSETSIDMHSTATMSVTANYTIKQSSTQTSTFAQTTLGTRIKQYIGSSISGVSNDGFRYVDNSLNSIPTKFFQQGSVIAFWLRRKVSNNNNGGVIMFGQTPLRYMAVDVINTTVLRIDGYDDWGGDAITWNSVPQDTQWHQYVLIIGSVITPNSPYQNKQQFHLYRDGVYQGLRETNNTNVIMGINSPIYLNSANNYGPNSFTVSGQFDMAQLWVGNFAGPNSVDASLFYDSGFVDLGPTGNGYGLLPTPIVYDVMDEPYSVRLVPNPGQSITPAAIPIDAPDMTARASLTVQAQNVLVIAASFTVTTNLTSKLTGTFLANSQISSSTNLTAETKVNKTFNIPLSTVVAQTTIAQKSAEASASMNTVATVTADGDVERGAFANLTSQATVVAVTGFLGSAVANLTSQATITINADRVKDVFMGVDSALNITASVNYTASAEFNQASTAALNCSANKIRGTQIDLLSDFAQSASAIKLAVNGSAMTVTATQTAQATQIKGGNANFAAITAVLSVGDIIQLDPYLTYVVEPETRYYKINRETRQYMIEAETREYTIQGYDL